MLWATRRLDRAEVGSVEQLFRDQTASFDTDRQMLLIRIDEDWPQVRLWVAVPDEALLTPYYGFALCRRADLPSAPMLVAGCPDRFAALFHGP